MKFLKKIYNIFHFDILKHVFYYFCGVVFQKKMCNTTSRVWQQKTGVFFCPILFGLTATHFQSVLQY